MKTQKFSSVTVVQISRQQKFYPKLFAQIIQCTIQFIRVYLNSSNGYKITFVFVYIDYYFLSLASIFIVF